MAPTGQTAGRIRTEKALATLAEQFRTALGNIEPEDGDVVNAADAHAKVRKVLQADAKLKGWGIDPILIGSYAREVSIRRVKDVDVFGRLTTPPADLRPGRALDEFERVLTKAYPGRVEPQHRSFKVDFPDFGLSVDAVPARPCGEHWELPSRPDARASWVETNPTELGRLTTEMNKDARYPKLGGQGVYVPTVKMIRQVRRAQLGQAPPGGLFMEICTYWVFDKGLPAQTTWAGYLTVALRGVATLLADVVDDGLDDPTLADRLISTKADHDELQAAADAMADAANRAEEALAEKDDCKSAVIWAGLFGENPDGPVFELPANCNADGTSRTAAGAVTTPGATRVPAGSGRYS